MESNSPDTKRQLAAILFADIAGYTALMQNDETTASALLRRFQKEIEKRVPEKNGRIANGNVGIGVDDPDARLEVNGQLQ